MKCDFSPQQTHNYPLLETRVPKISPKRLMFRAANLSPVGALPVPDQFSRMQTYQFMRRFQKHLTEKGQWPALPQAASTRLVEALGGLENIEHKWVLAGYGGGKDSTYMSAFVRLLQQFIAINNNGKSFNIRFVTNIQGGMLPSTLENIRRVYKSLGTYGDPTVQTLVVAGNQVLPFEQAEQALSAIAVREGNRTLKLGHLNYGFDGRAIFCDSCNISMVNGFDKGMTPDPDISGAEDNTQYVPASLIITGDSIAEQQAYLRWPHHVAKKLGLSTEVLRENKGFVGFQKLVNSIGNHLSEKVHGAKTATTYTQHTKTQPQFFNIYGDAAQGGTAYAVSDHRAFIHDDLDFRLDENDFAVAFTESDCFNPLVMAYFFAKSMAHLCEIGAFPNLALSPEEALKLYLEQHIIPLMREKHFPDDLIKLNQKRFETPEQTKQTFRKIETLIHSVYGITPAQVECMIQSPFAEKGKNLLQFLQRRYPIADSLILEGIKAALCDYLEENSVAGAVSEHDLKIRLEAVSGLSVEELRQIYQQPLAEPIVGNSEAEVYQKLNQHKHPFNILRVKDPHKRVVRLPNDQYLLIAGR